MLSLTLRCFSSLTTSFSRAGERSATQKPTFNVTDCDDGCQDQKPDRPTGRFYDYKHADSPNVLKLGTSEQTLHDSGA
jgi:hypothetical protein